MKITWGHKIAGVYLLFVVGILFLAFKASQQKFDLVTENYYDEELKYQHVIDEKQHVAELTAPPEVVYANENLNVYFPADFDKQQLKGEVYLYRPSDARKDLRRTFAVSDNHLKLTLPAGLSGLYDLKLSWQANGKSYLHEQKIVF